MSKMNLLSITLLLTTVFSYSQCPNVVWGDEFSGSSLDQTKWNYQIGDGCSESICGWGNNELQSYQEANVNVSNGTLQITALKQRTKGSKYTSGRINSKGKGDFTYGRFEALIKLPYGDGLWPAFWMLSTNEPYGGWPQSGEIDIMEFTASNPTNAYGNIHYGDPYPGNQYQGNDFDIFEGAFPDAFHEFAIEWEANEIRWYIDGILYSTKTSADIAPYNWPFNDDFHFLLNVAVGGTLGGPVNDTMLPATMEVDYVRVYDGFRPSIQGKFTVANQAQGEVFSLTNLPNGTSVAWSVPSDAVIVSGQGTENLVVDFGTSSGYVAAVFNSGCENQTLKIGVNVEPPFIKDYSFENFDEPSAAVFQQATGSLTETLNPATNAVNSSAAVGRYERNATELYDLLVYDIPTVGDADLYVSKDKKVYMDVYTSAPIGTEIILQLESSLASPTNFPDGRHSRYVGVVSENNHWEQVEFVLLDQPDPSVVGVDVSTMILLYNSNTYTSDTYYFDNLDSYNVDLGGGSNQAPAVSITSPSSGSSFSEGSSVTISADASDSDGTIASVEFLVDGASIGVDNSAPYSVNWTIPAGSYDLAAKATDNEGALTTSSLVSVTGTTVGGEPTVVYVSSITTGTAGAGKGKKYGTATIEIVDDLSSLVANANVSVTFSGTFSESASGSTDANGLVTVQTTGSANGTLVVDVCVDNVSASLPYSSGDNTITCTGSAARVATTSTSSSVYTTSIISIYPNPFTEVIKIATPQTENEVFISIMDLAGKKLIEITGQTREINVSQLPAGMYFLEFKSGDLKEIIKIVK